MWQSNDLEACLIDGGELALDAELDETGRAPFYRCPEGHRYHAEYNGEGAWPTDEGFEDDYPEYAGLIAEREQS